MIKKALCVSFMGASLALSGLYATNLMAADANIIYLTRHAEKLDTGSDPSLSDAGKLRANNIASMLKKANINAIYSTSYNRTLETAAPLSELISVGVQAYDPFDLSGFATSLKTLEGNTMVVGHSNTTPELVGLLGGDAGTAIDESEYDRLYQLIFNQDGSVTTVRFTSLPSEADTSCEFTGINAANLTAEEGDWTYYELDVPECAASLNVSMSGGTGDADMYLKFADKPTKTQYDCRPFETGNSESCHIANPEAGIYHLGLFAYDAYSSVSVSSDIQ